MKMQAIEKRISRLQSDLDTLPVQSLESRKLLFDDFIDDIHEILRHINHRIKLIFNGFYDGFIVIAYINVNHIELAVVCIEGNKVVYVWS